MPKYWKETAQGPVEVSKVEYISGKIQEFMKQPVGGKYGMEYSELEIDLSERKLPAGV